MKRINRKVLQGLFQLYKKGISPFLPCACRFFPTCSEYAYIAAQKHGFWKGGRLTLRRLLRCHPWGGSGVDNPPDVFPSI